MIRPLLLVLAVCADGFAAAVSIGAEGIRMPLRSSAVISLAGTLSLCLSAALGEAVGTLIPTEICRMLSALLLAALGTFSILKNFCGEIARKSSSADSDNSKSISLKEALALSLALSADSLAVGAGAGLGGVDLPLLAVMTFAAGLLFLETGWRLGRRLRSALKINLSRFCGAILIILAFIR